MILTVLKSKRGKNRKSRKIGVVKVSKDCFKSEPVLFCNDRHIAYLSKPEEQKLP